MLARTFKSAAELGMEQHEYDALVTVLYHIEDGTIPPEKINMRHFHCGTAHCLAGWANTVDEDAFPETNSGVFGPSLSARVRRDSELGYLFGLGHSPMRYAAPKQARDALRGYLESGRCPRYWG